MPPRNRQYSVSSTGSYSTTSSGFSHTPSLSTASVPDLDRGYHGAVPGGLPCEFVGYSGCEQNFDPDDFDSWIEHIVSVHLRGQLPKTVVCWFCDDEVFDSKKGSRELNFRQRMWHIRDHILQQGLTLHNIRPDHYLNTHLWNKRLIDESVFYAVRRYAEVAQGSWILPHDAMPPERQARDSRQGVEYVNPHDEERSYRRHQNRGSAGETPHHITFRIGNRDICFERGKGGGVLSYRMTTGGSMRQTQPQSSPRAGPHLRACCRRQAAGRLVASILGMGDRNLHFRMSESGTAARPRPHSLPHINRIDVNVLSSMPLLDSLLLLPPPSPLLLLLVVLLQPNPSKWDGRVGHIPPWKIIG
ncbi:hypothetical protein F5B18DRAFT_478514 [Nemania serpens]|nr:hypothetical protein F5B18DRAFT_478514 [Nemania serpens]